MAILHPQMEMEQAMVTLLLRVEEMEMVLPMDILLPVVAMEPLMDTPHLVVEMVLQTATLLLEMETMELDAVLKDWDEIHELSGLPMKLNDTFGSPNKLESTSFLLDP